MKRLLASAVLLCCLVPAAAFADINASNGIDLTGMWRFTTRDQRVSVEQVGNNLYMLIEGQGIRNITVASIVKNVVSVTFCGDIPGSKNHNYTNLGTGIVTDNGRRIAWKGGFLNNQTWVKSADW